MTEYADLTPYVYDDLDQRWSGAVNVGWIQKTGYPKGSAAPGLVPALLRLSHTHEANVMRGAFQCRFCHADAPIKLPIPGIDGERAFLGMSEIHLEGPDGIVYAAPNLIAHYVQEHDYLPPAQFVEAALWVDERARGGSDQS